jgi:serine phosphatase RsbU (regulator of sigma subunit)
MRWIGASMAFLVFEESNRHLTLGNLPGIPQSVRIGALDFDVRACAYFVFAIAMLIAMTFRFRRIQERNRKVEQELAAAAALQSLLLSSRSAAVGSFSIESVYQPAGEVGGDFFHVAPARDGGLVVVVGDVSGKGLKAAMTVASIIGALRDFAEPRPAAILAHLNRVLHGQIGGFVTCCVAHLEPDGTLLLANAGHIPPYCNGVEIDCAAGLPLGIIEQQEWDESEVRLEADARLIFVSDGVVEAAKTTGELFGFDRTREISNRGVEAIAAAAQAFASGAAQNDDITVLGVQYQPAAAVAG